MSTNRSNHVLTATHWGTYVAEVSGGRLTGMLPWEEDPDPSPIGRSMVGAVNGDLRVAYPTFRKEWLERRGARAEGRRGSGPFVEVEWDQALDLVAGELERVRRDHGNAAIYGGSYGWASAGRFHHAQSQLHRFLNMAGGYTASVNAYSYAAGEVILPHVIGSMQGLTGHHSTWDGIVQGGGLVVAFGGMPRRNAQVQGGALGRHTVLEEMRLGQQRGLRFISLSPVRDDGPDGIEFEWQPLQPGVDTAVMLGIAHVLLSEGLEDRAFLARYCTGFDQVRAYILGQSDGIAKTAQWAAGVSGLAAERIVELARLMASRRTMIMVNWAIQRADFGEQPYWMAVTLASMLGQIGLPGGGFGFGYSSTNGAGRAELPFKWPSLSQGKNPVETAIPVARITDMLLNPNTEFDYNGRRLTYPDIRLVYWAGGNPFHHHQDLNRLVEAWQRPETVIVHELFWTATARHADIVFPVTTSFERNDLGMANRDALIVAMKQAMPPVAGARDDYAIFADLAKRMGIHDLFTEGRSAEAWIEHFYNEAISRAKKYAISLPSFETFWKNNSIEVPNAPTSGTLLGAFRADPLANPLRTPSGRIELYSKTIASFGYADCPGHAVWREPREWRGGSLVSEYPLHLLTPQPADKLHSQFDQGSVSLSAKVAGRARLLIHREDAQARGIQDGDICEVFNARGACLAGAQLTDTMMPGIVQIPTGAWFDPAGPGEPERHGNPNVLTPDRGTSALAQGCSCNSTLVDVKRYQGEPPAITVHEPPAIIRMNVKELFSHE